MRTSLSFGVGVTLGLLGGLLLGLRLRSSDGQGSRSEDPGEAASSQRGSFAPSSEAPQDRVELPERIAVESSASQPAALAPDPALLRERFAALEDALAQHPPWTGDTAALEAKYAGLSDGEKLLADYALGRKLEAERNRIVAELLRNAECEVHSLDGDAPITYPKTSPNRPTVSYGFAEENTPSGMVVKVASIDPARFPEFHALEMECWWLGTHLRHKGIIQGHGGSVRAR